MKSASDSSGPSTSGVTGSGDKRARDNHDGGKRRTRRGERGATLTEYALIVACFAVPTISAINFMKNVSKTKIEHTADGVSNRPAP